MYTHVTNSTALVTHAQFVVEHFSFKGYRSIAQEPGDLSNQKEKKNRSDAGSVHTSVARLAKGYKLY